MMDKKLSVIVPVYKAELYLDQCIASITGQIYSNLEIILVDDGSPDRSGEICDRWAEKDSRIHVIHQENKGGAIARNVGMDQATGEWMTFVDSDDYIAPWMYESLCQYMADDVDIVECDYLFTDNDEAKFDLYNKQVKPEAFNSIQAMEEHIADLKFKQSMVNKIYRKSVIGSIRMTGGKNIDDEFFTYQVIGKAKRLLHLPLKYYAYRQQEDSVMHSMDIYKRLQAVEAKIERHQYICRFMPELTLKSLLNLWFTCIYLGQLSLRIVSDGGEKEILSFLSDVLKKYPMSKQDLKCLSRKEKLWVLLANQSLNKVCKIRNRLKIGL